MVIETGYRDAEDNYKKMYEYTWSPLKSSSFYKDVKTGRVFSSYTGGRLQGESWGLLIDEVDREARQEWKPVVTPLG